MEPGDLRSRIDSLKKNNITEQKKSVNVGNVLVENGWNRIADMVYEKVSVKKNILPDVISEVLLDKNTASGTSHPTSRFVFYDTETTGLSAGAGNIVFLAGFGEKLPGSDYFQITQLFLSDFPGEPSFLERVKDFLKHDHIYVSYNGKSFDSNVLRTRFTMNRIKADSGFQLDLLYPCRRLWKNIIGSCSLRDIERKVLDKHRELDVPGYMVPDLYFEFIRNGRWKTVEAVMAHHLEDINSLAELLTVQEQLFSEAGQPSDFYDPLGLSSILMEKKPESAAEVLKTAFKSGNSRAGIELGFYYKRNNQLKDAENIWISLWEQGQSISAGIELAKYYEHHLHNFDAASKITLEMLNLERFKVIPYKDNLEKRKKRLEIKIKQNRV